MTEGAWIELYPKGVIEVRLNFVINLKFVSNKNEFYFMYSLKNNSLILRIVIN